MPELVEVEAYRRLLESHGLRRRIAAVHAPDAWYLKGGVDAAALEGVLVGASFRAARRHGKLLLADVAGGPTLGLRFGMTGRLVVDAQPGVERLIYSSERDDVAAWDRFVVVFADGGDLRMRDPRRLGGVALEPDVSALGPDAASVTAAQLRDRLAGRTAPLKASLMDQAVVAGLGNLMVDELLWRARLDPAREAGSLDKAEMGRLHRAVRRTVEVLGERGGSHTGDLMPERHPGGRCPRDGTELARRRFGGRTTWSCPQCQR